ncbi:MAG: MGMT family protein [Lachnospiraceae bacterium]|nr:MGMT family protein [Lachnospiraceae bacterium]
MSKWNALRSELSRSHLQISLRVGGIVVEQSAFELIYDIVKQIPKGTVATYGQVAALAGNKRWARVVGYALHANPDPAHIPCHRVVNREGAVSEAFAFGGGNRQVELLRSEGVEVVAKKVDLEKYRWKRMTMEMLQKES